MASIMCILCIGGDGATLESFRAHNCGLCAQLEDTVVPDDWHTIVVHIDGFNCISLPLSFGQAMK